jgi:hypothetical protein
LALAACLALAWPTGCSEPLAGYSFERPYPSDVETVFVKMATRGPGVYRRGLEFRVTEAVCKQLELDTPYRIASAADADTQLTLGVELVRQGVLSHNPDTGRPQELEVTLVAEYEWKDLRDGRVRRQARNLRVSGAYAPPAPMGEDFFLGSEDAVNRLAKRVVEQLERDW